MEVAEYTVSFIFKSTFHRRRLAGATGSLKIP